MLHNECIKAGHSKLIPTPGSHQTLVTGNGGPSGTGKRPAGEPILPPPIFVQDLVPTSNKPSVPAAAAPTPPLTRNTSWSSSLGKESKSSPPLNTSTSSQVGSDSPSLTSKESPVISDNEMTTQSHPTVGADVNSNASTSTSLGSYMESQSNSVQSTNSSEHFTSSADLLARAEMLSPLQKLSSGGRSEPTRHQVAVSAFNGLGSSTVFPVPFSSLSISVWSTILHNSNNTLEVNPYDNIAVPISELMDLTLPPVDAIGSGQWPKPLTYYRRAPEPFKKPAVGYLPPSAPPAAALLQQVFPSVKLSYGPMASSPAAAASVHK